MTPSRVTVVIPTLNAGAGFDEVLEAVANQDGELEAEVLAVDSGSTDGTLVRLQRAGARVLSVPPGAFNHGVTRNSALSHARGELAVLLVQDAVPASRRWLSELVSPLQRDPLVAGSFARQVPAAGASRVTKHYHSRWIGAQADPRVAGPLTREDFARLSPPERHAVCAFDNVCSCVRLSVWRQYPFKPTPIAEDLEWGRDVLLAGYKIAYVPEAVVTHSHERPVAYELQRTYLVHQRLEALFGLSTVPTLMSLARSVAETVPLNARLAAGESRSRVRAMLRGAALGLAMPLGQYLGARSSRDGRDFLRPRGI